MTTHEERLELMTIAHELHAQLRSFTQRVHLCINKLIGEADALKLAAADEVSAGTSVTKKNVTYTGRVDTTQPNTTLSLSPARLVEEFPERVALVAPAPGKRACSLCREPGHRATNCPNAHKVQAAAKAKVAARPVKKVRGPVTPERRAQLAEQLKRARAARKGK